MLMVFLGIGDILEGSSDLEPGGCRGGKILEGESLEDGQNSFDIFTPGMDIETVDWVHRNTFYCFHIFLGIRDKLKG